MKCALGGDAQAEPVLDHGRARLGARPAGFPQHVFGGHAEHPQGGRNAGDDLRALQPGHGGLALVAPSWMVELLKLAAECLPAGAGLQVHEWHELPPFKADVLAQACGS